MQQQRPTKRPPVSCPGCGGTARWHRSLRDAGWSTSVGGYACECGWALDERDPGIARLAVNDGRIRSRDDVAPRIEGARQRREADPLFAGREVLRALHELYCETAVQEGWVEILAADVWAEQELTRRLARRVHRTQVRRSRLALEGLGYVRRSGSRRESLKRTVARYRLEKKKPPIMLEVLKAGNERKGTE